MANTLPFVTCLVLALFHNGWGENYLQNQYCNTGVMWRVPFEGANLYSQYGATYQPHRDCMVTVAASSSNAKVRVAISRITLALPNCADNITFYDGPTILHRAIAVYCGSTPLHEIYPVTSSGYMMSIRFTTGSGLVAPGFLMKIINLWNVRLMQDELCGMQLSLGLLHVSVLSQGGPVYAPNRDCTVVIQSFSSSNMVKLRYRELNLADDSCDDQLTIYDGPGVYSPTLQEQCGSDELPPDVVSTGQYMTLQFTTGASSHAHGFNVEVSNVWTYTCYVCDQCPVEGYKDKVEDREHTSNCYACLKIWELSKNYSSRGCASSQEMLRTILEEYDSVGDEIEFEGCRDLKNTETEEDTRVCVCKGDKCNQATELPKLGLMALVVAAVLHAVLDSRWSTE